MAKTMARIHSGTVVNMEWHSDTAPETANLKNTNDRPVRIGDVYENGKFYRDGVEVLTPMEAELARLRAENADMRAALEVIYEGVTE